MLNYQTLPPVLPESYGYVIVLGIGAFMAVIVTFLIKAEMKWLGTKKTFEWFSTAGRNIKTGLIASSVVSAWTWAATLLQSSTVAYEFGIAGPFWYAAGASIQIILFGILAVGLKRHAPNAHTFPEIIKNKFGKSAHKVFLFFAILTNTVVTSMLVLGGAAVINSLTGIDIYFAAFMIPIGIIVYTFFGGLKATFIADYVNASFLFIVVLIFVTAVYFSSPQIGGISGMYERLTNAAQLQPVQGNSMGSYLTLASIGALAFGIINIIGNFGTVFVDQSYWLRAIAAKPIAAAKGYLLGGLAWFAIPFTLASTLGLAAIATNVQLTDEEVSLGLVAPNAAYTVLGDVGAIILLAALFTAVTSAGSAQLTAVSTLGTYDVYRTYLKPGSSDKELFRKSRLMIIGFGLGMGLLATALVQIGASLQYVYLVMGILIGPAVVPVALTLLWKKTKKYPTIFGAIGGLFSGVAIWLGSAQFLYGEISVQTTGNDMPLLLGNITSICVAGIVSFLGSVTGESRHPRTPVLGGGKGSDDNLDDKEMLIKASKFAKRYAMLFSSILVVIWPLPLFASGYVLSELDFHIWIVLAIVWAAIAAASTIVLPLIESKAGIIKVMQNSVIPLVFAGIITIAIIASWLLFSYEEEQRSMLLQLAEQDSSQNAVSGLLIDAIKEQGSYTFTFISVILSIIGTFAIVVIILNSRLRKLVQLQTQELMKANEDLKMKGRIKDEFLNVAAHELRTPIQPLLGFAELAKSGRISHEKAMDAILRHATRLRHLTNDILDVSKIETNNLEYHMERVNIVDLLTSTAEGMKPQLSQGVVLETKFDPRITEITVDKGRMIQVFTNILGNAAKFTSKGSIKIETFYVALSRDLRIKFEDTGVGIPNELLVRMFEKFVTKDIDGKNHNGTGLGLYICRRILEGHGGTVEAYNNTNGGATIEIVLPTRSESKSKHEKRGNLIEQKHLSLAD